MSKVNVANVDPTAANIQAAWQFSLLVPAGRTLIAGCYFYPNPGDVHERSVSLWYRLPATQGGAGQGFRFGWNSFRGNNAVLFCNPGSADFCENRLTNQSAANLELFVLAEFKAIPPNGSRPDWERWREAFWRSSAPINAPVNTGP